MLKIKFICKQCKKEIEVQENIYEKIYKNSEICLSCKSTNDFKRLDETAQYGRARDYIVHIEGMLIKEIATAGKAENLKLVNCLQKKFEEVKKYEMQLSDYEIRKYIICEHIEMLQEIQTIVKAHQE